MNQYIVLYRAYETIYSIQKEKKMSKINAAEKMTHEKFLNLYKLHAENKKREPLQYLVASRAKEVDDLKAINHEEKPDAVAIVGVLDDERVVLIKQYRYPIGDYIYEFPAGLVDDGENISETAIREMKEETGLDFVPMKTKFFSRAFYSSAGMTDESCFIICGKVSGTVSTDKNESTEEIEVVLADGDEIKRILREEKVCMKTALVLMGILYEE